MSVVYLTEYEDWHHYTKKYSNSDFTGIIIAENHINEYECKLITYHLVEGLLHRENDPAIEWDNGNKYWYKNDLQHRTDGPAVELMDGTKLWFLNGVRFSPEEHFNSLTIEQQEEAVWHINEWR